ncbi:MAG: choice-of-anchor Q domain-containing protein [Pyrinomonadaceae bacterium]
MKKLFYCNSKLIRFMWLAIFFTVASGGALGATFTVTKTADTNDGACDADCSLREAIAMANAAAGDDIINFDAGIFATAQTINLSGSQLLIENNGTLTVNGTGSDLLTISANNLSRVLRNEGGTAIINGLKLTRGNGVDNTSSGTGGAVFNVFDGSLTLNNSIVSASTASSGGGIYNNTSTLILNNTTVSGNSSGGGIYNNRGALTINNSVITGNDTNGNGGGVLNSSATANITNSTISNNTAESSGAGIANSGTVNLTGSTVSGNSSESGGGGIFSFNNQTIVNISNSTISGNTATGEGGGLAAITGATFNIFYSTIAYNVSDSDSSGLGSGGGIGNSSGGIINTRSSIIARNIDNTAAAPDFRGTMSSQGYNLVGNILGLNITGTSTGNILGQDALLLPLGSYGGLTKTHALQPNSPAIDAADPANFPATDQRNLTRPRDGDLNGTSLPDIGAFERQVLPLTVTKTADTNDGACAADCSLREAIAAANASGSPELENVIIFNPAVFNAAQTITLTLGELQINNSGIFSIQGTGSNLLTISGNNSSRVFYITGGATVTLSNLKITGGNGTGTFSDAGGGIYNNNSTLSLTNSVVTANTASFGAGGIYNTFGTLDINNSTVSNNSAGNIGGGVYNNNAGRMSVVNSTFTGNSSFNGGGIHNFGGMLTVSNSSFNGNTAGGGGGIQNIGDGTLSITNSTFNNNTASIGGGGINSTGTLTVKGSTVSNNLAIPDGSGGGLNCSGNTKITDTIISDNTAGFSAGGIGAGGSMTIDKSSITRNTSNNRAGGIDSIGTLVIRTSAITGNTAAQFAGGIKNNGALTVATSTVSGNAANASFGGGIFNESSSTSYIIGSTVVNNRANSGGGVKNNSGTLVARNSIIADNIATNASSHDFAGTLFSQGYNIIENVGGTTIAGSADGNITGQDPKLAPLANNGGPTQTHALLPDSPAIDAAGTGQVDSYDQRFFSRPGDGDGDGFARADIGAFELRAVMVSNTADSGAGSLRQALANVAAQGDAVIFNLNVFDSPQLITLTSGELVIPANAAFSLNGRGADKLTISGNNQSRIFFINSGANVTIHGVTLTGGNGTGAINSGHDGAISSFGSLTLSSSIVRNNSANGNGGGIGAYLGTLSVINSTIRNNSTANIGGGGIYIGDSTGKVIGSTISSNTAAGDGGGIINISSTLAITNSTISGNTSGGGGGGVSNFGASSTLNITNSTISSNITNNSNGGGIGNFGGGAVNTRNTIIADNIATGFGTAHDFSGVLTSQGYNLIENTTGTTIIGTTVGNILGQDPQLLPLGNYGGFTQTHALRPNSPAIDKGSAVNGLTADQRGLLSPVDFLPIQNAPNGNGSDIGAFERQNVDVALNTPFDFDGDGKTDISIFRPNVGEWWYSKSSDGGNYAAQFGNSADKLVPGDYTGDGRADIAVFRPVSGEWFILRSEDGSYYSYPFGTSGDIPTVGDFDGDGKADSAVFRPSDTNWYIRRSSDSGFTIEQFGANGDVPAVADYDGDGKSDIAIWRASVGEWWIKKSSNNSVVAFQFGNSSDKPVQGDYTGDGKADVAIYRPSTGEWFILRSENYSYYSFPFGTNGDVPAPGDYDGDGRFDATVFRPSGSTWYVQRSTAGTLIQQFGIAGDKPVPNAFVP